MKKLSKLQQWVAYKIFLEEIKKLKIENKLPDIYPSLLAEYKIDDEIRDIDEEIKREMCPHKNTEIKYNHDSHYDYEDTYCEDCGKELDSVKV